MATEQERWEKALGLSGMTPAQTTSQVEDPRERQQVAQQRLGQTVATKESYYEPERIEEQRRLKAERYREGAKARWAKALGVDRTDPSQQRQPMRVHTRETVTEARKEAETTAHGRRLEVMERGAELLETAAEKAAGRKTKAEKARVGYRKEEREDIQEWQAGQNDANRAAAKSLHTLRHKLDTKQLAETIRYHDALIKGHEQDLAQAMKIAESVRADRQKGMAADNSVAMLKSWQSQYVMLGQRLKAFEYDLAQPDEKVSAERKKEIKDTIKEIGTAIGAVLGGMKTERARLTKLTEGVEAPKKLDEELAKQYLVKAGGDKEKARELVRKDGFSF